MFMFWDLMLQSPLKKKSVVSIWINKLTKKVCSFLKKNTQKALVVWPGLASRNYQCFSKLIWVKAKVVVFELSTIVKAAPKMAMEETHNFFKGIHFRKWLLLGHLCFCSFCKFDREKEILIRSVGRKGWAKLIKTF